MIPVAEPNLTGKEQEYVADAIASGWVSGGGPYVERFEDMVAKACGKRWCVATTTGSAALHVALEAQWGDLAGRGVPMPSFTFVAAANVLSMLNAQIVFEDIEKGWSPDISRVGEVWDAASAVGQSLPKIGMSCLSFNGNKNITTGQGGAVVGDGAEESFVRALVNNCKTGSNTHSGVGYNYRMPNINAAMGCAQMERLDEFLHAKNKIFQRYLEYGIRMVPSGWMAIWDAKSYIPRKFAGLHAGGIAVRPFWKPIHLQGWYENMYHAPLPRTEALWNKLICLPCSTNLTEEDQDKVIKCVASL